MAYVQKTEMSKDLTEEVLKRAKDLISQGKTSRQAALQLKNSFDSEHGRAWHCIVGRDFNSFVTYETGKFVDFVIDDLNFILFKAGGDTKEQEAK